MIDPIDRCDVIGHTDRQVFDPTGRQVAAIDMKPLCVLKSFLVLSDCSTLGHVVGEYFNFFKGPVGDSADRTSSTGRT